MRSLFCITLLLVVFLSAGCAELRRYTWQAVDIAVKKGADDAFNKADANGNKQVDKDEFGELIDELMKPVKEVLLGDE